MDITNIYNNNDNSENEDLMCPISLMPFTHPLVLDCGHTIDKSSFDKLNSKKTCPICSRANNSNDRVNWILVSLLKLDIQQTKDNKTTKRISAQEAKNILLSAARSYAEYLIDNEIMKKINHKINIRERKLIYKMDDR